MNYFMIGGDKREYGPVDAELIRQWLREGRANGDTLLRLENEAEWKPLRTFTDFAESFPQPDSPLPPTADAAPEARISVRHTFARAWHLVGEHFVEISGACLLVWMALTAMAFVPFAGPILAMVFHGPIYGGLFLFFLKLIREGDATPGDVFVLPGQNAGGLIATGIITLIITELATVCCLILPGIYLEIAWLFAIPLVADKGLNPWPAMGVSRRIITRFWFRMFALFILAFLPVVVFHLYMNARLMADVSPHLRELFALWTNVLSDPAAAAAARPKVDAILKEVRAVQEGYSSWVLMRQALLLVSMPLGAASLACVYEDFFGRKK